MGGLNGISVLTRVRGRGSDRGCSGLNVLTMGGLNMLTMGGLNGGCDIWWFECFDF